MENNILANHNDLLSKKKLKWFRSRIEDFNKNSQYQMDALTSCKNNIRKQYRLENFAAVRQERRQAERTIRCLKQLQEDVEILRQQVVDEDLAKFDLLVEQSRSRISNILHTFNQYYDSLPLNNGNGITKEASITKSLANGFGSSDDSYVNELQKQVVFMQAEDDLYQREVAQEVENLERDSRDLNHIFKHMAEIINSQKEAVDNIETQVEESHANVISAQRELAQAASKLRGAAYPLVGAIIGSCVGGPIGFVAGLKVGSVVAVTGSVIGFSGGRVLKKRQQQLQKTLADNSQNERNAGNSQKERNTGEA